MFGGDLEHINNLHLDTLEYVKSDSEYVVHQPKRQKYTYNVNAA